MSHLTEVSLYDSENYLVLDFETTNKSYGSALDDENSILLSCYLAGNGTRIHSHWGGIYSLGSLISDIEAADFIVCHNAKFELQWLAKAGLDLSKVVVFDTLIADYVLHGGLSVELGLGAVAQRYGFPGKEPYVDICMKGRVCPSELPKSLVERRCKYDVAVTHNIFLQQREKLRDTGQLATLWTRCILTPVLADIEKNGMALDKDRVLKIYEDTLREAADLQQQLEDITGGINLNSAKQRAEFLYDTLEIKEPCDHKGNPLRTSAGGRKTDQATILSLKGRTKEQKNFLELYKRYATLNAKLTKSLNTYKEVVDNDDLLHAQFNQARTRTQRLSSTGFKYSIQLQNQAREFKPLFCARNPDWLIAEIDGAQLEFRVAAFLGQDETAVHDIEKGFDVHSHTAKVMTDAGQPTTRQEAKSRTFKPLFGGSSGTKAEQEYYKSFKLKYPGITSAQQRWIDEAVSTQKVKTVTGLIFHYPGTQYTRSGFVTNTTQICNYSVQSFATADIIPIALTYLWHALREAGLQSFIVNTIHDSAVLEVHPDEVEEVRQIAVKCFTTDVYNYLKIVYNIEFNVPLGTGFKAGKYWTEGEEIIEAVPPPFKF